MEAIFASKFYKASTRKDSIKAALTDPINHELVQQLSDYIGDDEWRRVKELTQLEEPTVENVPEETQEEDSNANGTVSDSETSVPTTHSAPSVPHIANHHLSNMLKDEEGGESGEVGDIPTPEVSEESSTEETDSTVSESTGVDADISILATEDILACDDISSQVDSIAGILNSGVDTTGVRRCSVKAENELWIYYNDSINLNNVMEPVISLLNASNYGYLDFNRLARTDNAIVFSIAETPKPIEPENESDE